MKQILAVAALALLSRPTSVHAIAACNNNEGFAPATGSTVPTHAKLVYFSDNWRDPTFTAKIGGKAVKVIQTELPSGSATRVMLIEIDSDKTGTLELSMDKYTALKVTVAKKVTMPKEVPVTIGRFQRTIQHSTVEEEFDGLSIRLPKGTPAVSAVVKLRRDAKATGWTTLEVPVSKENWDDPRLSLKIGRLGCTSNYAAPLLKSGVDIEVTVRLVDGSLVPVKDLAPHLTLPDPLPPQPKSPKRP